MDTVSSDQSDKRPTPSKPVSMPSIGKTLKFPREDNVFKGKESIPYDEASTIIWRERPRLFTKRENLMEWKAYFYIGILIGTIACLMTQIEEFCSEHIS